MRRFKLSFLFLIWIAFACDTSSNIGEPDKNYFLKYFGGDGNQYAVDLIVNSDGTFYILGNSRKSQSETQKIFVAKADEFGRLIWQKTYGTVETVAKDFILTSDGKLAIVANVQTSVSNMDILLLRALPGKDSLQNIESVMLQIEPSLTATPKNEYANSLIELADGGFLVAGYTDYTPNSTQNIDALHLRTNSSLVQLTKNADGWNEANGNGVNNYGVSAFQTLTGSPSNFYVFGYNDHLNSTDTKLWAFGIGSAGAATDNSDTNNL